MKELRQRKITSIPETKQSDDDEKHQKAPIQTPIDQRNSSRICAILFILALIVRMYRISIPTEVVFDEVHFGGFARHYVNRDYFMDVHPPVISRSID